MENLKLCPRICTPTICQCKDGECLLDKKLDKGNISDGYHTFNELYHYRMLYNALIFNEWAKHGVYQVHKSLRHSDGELCFGGGWFVVVAMLPTGMITNHYKVEHWDLFKIDENGRSPIPYDGHTPTDVANRISEFLKQ